MSLKHTHTEMFAKIWEKLYAHFGDVSMVNDEIFANSVTCKINIFPTKKYGYNNNFEVGETVYVARYNTQKKKYCYEAIFLGPNNHAANGRCSVRIKEGDRGFTTFKDEDQIARCPDDFEGTWAIRVAWNRERPYGFFADEKWQKTAVYRGDSREMTVYPRNFTELEEAIDHIEQMLKH